MTQMIPAVTILHITDLHMMPNPGEKLLGVDTEKTFHTVLAKALNEIDSIDLILITGDLAQEPCRSSYQKILKKLENYVIPSVCLPGNHDDYKLMLEILNSNSISCRKQLVLKNWQIICLNSQIPDSPGGHLSSDELSFLENGLRQYPAYPALVAVHHHCQTVNSTWMDTMMIDNSEELLSVVTKYPNVKAIICGHIHQEMDHLLGSIRILGTPSTCFQFKPQSSVFSIDDGAPGYRIIELYADGHIESEIAHLEEKIIELQTRAEKY